MRKRVMLSLEIDNVARLHALFQKHGIPKQTLSFAVDDFIVGLADILERAAERGTMTVSDVLREVAEQLEEKPDEG